MMDLRRLFVELGLVVLERGWLSSNSIVFSAGDGAPATVVDTGHSSHARQTVALIGSVLQGRSLERIVNTHLHSDHCGGNAELQTSTGCEVWIPDASWAAASAWDEIELGHEPLGQACPRFAATHSFTEGDVLRLSGREWVVLSAAGHDPRSLMFFEPDNRVLISADALWEERLPIIFPELAGQPGFAAAARTLERIAELDPRVVIPGHGRPFANVSRAIERARRRVEAFSRAPEEHLERSARALAMFHMLEHGSLTRIELQRWIDRTPIFAIIEARGKQVEVSGSYSNDALVDKLLERGNLIALGAASVSVPSH